MTKGVKEPARDRFWRFVDVSGECWIWTGYRLPDGYGTFAATWNGNKVMAHRWAYEALVGPIPNGLVLDHLCRVPACVNPAHLEPVTHRENVRRGDVTKLRDNCRRGHPFTPDNTYQRRNSAGFLIRSCRTCTRDGLRARRADRRVSS